MGTWSPGISRERVVCGAAGGRAIPSKTLRWREKDVGSAAVPITMQRTFYISPAAGGFRAIRAAVDAKAAAADAVAADADGWLTIEAFGQALPSLAAATKIWRPLFDDEEQLASEGLAFMRARWEAERQCATED